MMGLLKPSNFLETCSFNCNLAWLFGYFHFKINYLTVRKKRFCEILRLICYLVGGAYLSMKSANINIGSFSSTILMIGIKFLITLTIFNPTIFRLFNFIMKKEHLKIINNINGVDENFKKLGIIINYEKHMKIAITVTGCYFMLLCIALFNDAVLFINFFPELKMEGSEIVFGIINLIAYLTYNLTQMLITMAIHGRIKLIAKLLQSMNLNTKTIKSISKIHMVLYDTMNSINLCYSLNILSFFFQFTFFVIFFFFDILHLSINFESLTINDLVFTSIQFGYLQYFFWYVAWMISHSGLLKNEVDELETIVQTKGCHERNFDITNSKCFGMINLQLQHSRLEISCGFFSLNWSFIFLLIGTVFSYVTILIQFDIET